MIWFDVLSNVVSFCLLPISFVWLYVAYNKYPGLFEQMGMRRTEVGLLILGASMGVFTNLPLIVYKGSLMALNLGGALIPIVVSYHLGRRLYKNSFEHRAWALIAIIGGVGMVSLLTNITTTFDPSIGVYANFPYYLIAPIASASYAIAIYSTDGIRASPLAYISGSIGTLIGADVVRIPQIFVASIQRKEQFIGSIGGAGVLDMVFLSGLIAFDLAILATSSKYKSLEPSSDVDREKRRQTHHSLEKAEQLLKDGRYGEAVKDALDAVNTRLHLEALHLNTPIDKIMSLLGIDWYKQNDYYLLKRTAEKLDVSYEEAKRAVHTAALLVEHIDGVERKRYATLAQRLAAFLIDTLRLLTAFASIFYFYIRVYYPRFSFETNLLWLVVIAMWWWPAQILYFTISEWLWTHSIGKMMLGLKVVNERYERCSLIETFARNTLRILDMLPLAYLCGVLFIHYSRKSQRIGDYIGGTLVLKGQKPWEAVSTSQYPTF